MKAQTENSNHSHLNSRTISLSWLKVNMIRAIGLLLILFVIAVWKPLLGPDATMTHAIDVTPTPGPWNRGDVFVGDGNGTYKVYDNTGQNRGTEYEIHDPAGSFGMTGCAFDQYGNLYTTNYQYDAGQGSIVRKWDVNPPHALLQTINSSSNNYANESIVFDSNGNFYVGHSAYQYPGSNRAIDKHSPSGAILQVFNPTYETSDRGIDWLDLSADQHTMYYTSEGRKILRYDVSGSGTQLSALPTPTGSGKLFALRLLPPGDGTGGLLVADYGNIKRLDGSGQVVQTYDIPNQPGQIFDNWFALNLDPNGTSFWSGTSPGGDIAKFNIVSGTVEVGPIHNGNANGSYMGICVKGENTAALPAALGPEECSVPNPVVACPIQHESAVGATANVNTAIGNSWHTSTDLSIPGRGVSLLFARTYNSQRADTSGPLGYGWTHSYNMYILTDTTTSPNEYKVYQENGSVAPFPVTGTHYVRVMADLTRNADGSFVLTRTHGLDTFYFKPPADGSNVAKLQQIKDRNGYTTTLYYDNQDRLDLVIAPYTRTLTFQYAASSSLLQSVTDNTGDPGRKVTFGYDDHGDLTSYRDVGQQSGTSSHISTRYAYNNHLLTKITDPNNGSTKNYYASYTGSDKRVTSQTDPMDREIRVGYIDLGVGTSRAIVTDVLSVPITTTYDYDSNKLVQRTQNRNHQPAIWKYTYAPTLGVTSMTDPLNHTWRSTWDLRGNLTSTTDPLSNTITYTYYLPTNDLATVVNSAGITTTYRYNKNGNLCSVSRPLTQTFPVQTMTTNYRYTDLQHPEDMKTIIDPLQKRWNFDHEPNTGYLKSSANPLGDKTFYTNTLRGQPYEIRDPMGYTTTLLYNAYDETTVITNARGYTTTYGYDAVGNVLTITNALNYSTTYKYNADNQVIRVTRPDGTYTITDYDQLGRVHFQTDPLGSNEWNKTYYTYDDRKWETTIDRPGPDTTKRLISRYSYNQAGNLDAYQDEQRNYHSPNELLSRTAYRYYDDNQLKVVDYDDPNTHDVTYTYNSRGLRQTMTDTLGTVSYGYDSLDRLTSLSRDYGGGDIGSQVNYAYDLVGNITKITYPANRDGHRRNIGYIYNDASQMTVITGTNEGPGNDSDRELASFKYNHNGNLKEIDSPLDIGLTRKFGYDKTNQVVTATINFDGLNPFESETAYTRDPMGLILTTTLEEIGGVLPAFTDITDTYSYDALNRLTGNTHLLENGLHSKQEISSTWQMDNADQVKQMRQIRIVSSNENRVTDTVTTTTTVTTTYGYDNARQLSTMTTITDTAPLPAIDLFQYTPMGSRASRTRQIGNGQPLTTTYQYDQLNHLIFNSENTQPASTTQQYQYDGDGLRIRKQHGEGPYSTYVTSTWGLAGGTHILHDEGIGFGDKNFIYGPGNILLGHLGKRGVPLRADGDDKDNDGNTHNSTESDGTKSQQPQAQTPTDPPDPYYYFFYATDQQNNIRLIISHDDIVTGYGYESFGQRSCEGSYYLCYYQTPFGFAGQYTDDADGETNLQYMGARYYDPQSQQFLSRDPLSAMSGQPYAYANRNPVNYSDASGMVAERIGSVHSTGLYDDKAEEPPVNPKEILQPPVDPKTGGAGNAGIARAVRLAGGDKAAIERAVAKVRSVRPSEGRGPRGKAGQDALEEIYGPGKTGQHFKTQYGNRDPDLVVEKGGKIYAHESCVQAGSVRAGFHKLKQVFKDYELMQTKVGYTPIWHFWDGPPVPDLADTLRAFGIKYIVYNP